MHTLRTIAPDTYYVGASDRRLAKFENLFPIPRGVSYNTYLIADEKTVLLDAADAAVTARFLENAAAALAGRALDYLVINHMEPDHSATLSEVLLRWPGVQIVCNAKTVPMLKAYCPAADTEHALLVKEGDTLPLGSHTLRFLMAPMVHWPEVMMTFDELTGVLFSADAFGTFGALDAGIYADELNFARDWLPDARRYYANIVGKYGVPVQAVLKKAATLPIRVLAPLHGPIWRENLAWFLNKYDLWSRWQPEEPGIVILYGSMYGNTANAAAALAVRLAEKGAKNLAVHDLSCMDTSEAIAEVFRTGCLVLASPTYNGGIYLPMAALLEDMKALGVQGRTVALIENGSWAPMAGKLMAERLGEMKEMRLLEPRITLRGPLSAGQTAELDALADAILAAL